MSEGRDVLVLTHGTITDHDQGRIASLYVDPTDAGGAEVTLLTVSDDDTEHEHEVRIGDEFPFGDQTWILTEVSDPEGYDYRVVVRRAGGPG